MSNFAIHKGVKKNSKHAVTFAGKNRQHSVEPIKYQPKKLPFANKSVPHILLNLQSTYLPV